MNDQVHPPRIIKTAQRLPILIRIRDIILTILLWLMYLYFMRDFFFFLGDVLRWSLHGFRYASSYPGFRILPTILSYLEVIGILGGALIGWAVYNQLRFRGKNRRFASPPVPAEQLAFVYGLETAQVESWQKARTLTMHHDQNGHLTDVLTS